MGERGRGIRLTWATSFTFVFVCTMKMFLIIIVLYIWEVSCYLPNIHKNNRREQWWWGGENKAMQIIMCVLFLVENSIYSHKIIEKSKISTRKKAAAVRNFYYLILIELVRKWVHHGRCGICRWSVDLSLANNTSTVAIIVIVRGWHAISGEGKAVS